MKNRDDDVNRTTEVLVQYDALGLFELYDPRLIELVSAAKAVDLGGDPAPEGNTVCANNVACVNGGCFTVNYTCPVQKVCGNFVC